MLTPSIDNSLLSIKPIFSTKHEGICKKTPHFLAPQGHEKLQVPWLLWQEHNSEHGLLAHLQFPPVFNFLALFAVNRDLLLYAPCCFNMPKFFSSTSERHRKWAEKSHRGGFIWTVDSCTSLESSLGTKKGQKRTRPWTTLVFITHFASKQVKK